MNSSRSAKVQKILRHKRQASKLLGRYEGKMEVLSPVKHQAKRLQHEARELTLTLTPAELCELRRLRRCG